MVGIASLKGDVIRTHLTENWDKYVKYAVIIGTPIALGIGYMVYRNRQSSQAHASSGKKGELATNSVNRELTPVEKSQASKLKGNKYFKGALYEKAIECYTEAINLCPKEHSNDLSTFYQNRAAAYEQLKKYDEVVSDCTRALSYNKRYVKALNRRAKASEYLNDLRQSLEDITAVCILEGFQNQQSLVTADRVLRTLGAAHAKEAFQERPHRLPSNHFIRTYLSSFANDPVLNNLSEPDVVPVTLNENEEPEEELPESVVEQGPAGTDTIEDRKDLSMPRNWSKDSPFILVKKCLRQKIYDDIIQMCTEEIEEPNSAFLAEALLVRSTFYLLHGQGEQAEQDFMRLLNMPDIEARYKSNVLIKRGSLRMQNGLETQAMEDFDQACQIDPDNSDIYHHRGQMKLLLDKMDESVKDFDRCINLNPDFALAQVQKCFAEYRRAAITKSPMLMQAAMESFERTVNKFPKCGDGFALYAQALADSGLWEEADKNFEKAMDVEPDNANLYVHRGLLHIQWKQDMDGGLKMINEALRFDAKCEFAYETLGTLQVQRGNLSGAIELFDKAIELVKTEQELAHLYSLKDAAIAQAQVSKNLGITLPAMGF